MRREVLGSEAIGEEIAITGQLRFRLQDLQLGIDPGVVASPGIAEADERSPHRILSDADTLIGFLQSEIGRGGIQAKITQSDQ